jgi:hypothetical protein
VLCYDCDRVSQQLSYIEDIIESHKHIDCERVTEAIRVRMFHSRHFAQSHHEFVPLTVAEWPAGFGIEQHWIAPSRATTLPLRFQHRKQLLTNRDDDPLVILVADVIDLFPLEKNMIPRQGYRVPVPKPRPSRQQVR